MDSMMIPEKAASRTAVRPPRPLRWCRLLLVILALCLAVAGEALAYRTEHVVLVIVDGLRYADGLGDSAHAYVP